MKVLAIDIGAGTQDVLLYDESAGNVENCVKMVLPSPPSVFSAKVRRITRLRRPLFVKGSIIGGGAFASALRRHVESGLRVVMTEVAAYSVRNRLEEVRKIGIEVVEEDVEGFVGETLEIEEVNIHAFERFLTMFDVSLTDVDIVAVAVQDHGVPPDGVSNRRFRIQTMRELIEKNPRVEALAFAEGEIPPSFLRMRSAASAVKRQLPNARALLMDTAPNAVLGCLKDSTVAEYDTALVVNVGNGHTIAAVLSEGDVVGMLEHHTRLLTPDKLQRLVTNFANGVLNDEEVFDEGGHGVFYVSKAPGFKALDRIVATGPKRNIFSQTSLPTYFASPAGDVMMTGTLGLVEAAQKKF